MATTGVFLSHYHAFFADITSTRRCGTPVSERRSCASPRKRIPMTGKPSLWLALKDMLLATYLVRYLACVSISSSMILPSVERGNFNFLATVAVSEACTLRMAWSLNCKEYKLYLPRALDIFSGGLLFLCVVWKDEPSSDDSAGDSALVFWTGLLCNGWGLNLCKNTGQGDFGFDPEPVGPGESLANSNSDRCLLLISLVRSTHSGDGGGSS